MTDEKNNPRKKAPSEQEERLHDAITELILGLKGDGTIRSLALRIGIPRKRLAEIFKSHYARLNGEAASPYKWKFDPLFTLAQTLGIPLSELIRAAEDIQDGLPPWFHMRVTKDARMSPQIELAHIFLEAVGCRSYGDDDPLNIKGRRKSRKYGSNARGVYALFSMYSDADRLRDLAMHLFFSDDPDMRNFVDRYQAGGYSRKEVYFIMKKLLDNVFSGVDYEEPNENRASLLLQRLHDRNLNLSSELFKAVVDYHEELSKKSPRG